MELKHYSIKTFPEILNLLIVPYGIETEFPKSLPDQKVGF